MYDNEALQRKYWTDFGYRIAGPVAASFTGWIREEIENNSSITDVFFIARDGYLPNLIYPHISSSKVKPHYVYAPRSILLGNDDQELSEFSNYISKINVSNGTIAVVDTITNRFSAQVLIGSVVENPVVGLYWMLNSKAKEMAQKKNIPHTSFMKDNERCVPCWDIVEFILSAPERPIKAIRKCEPIYYSGNSYEETRIYMYNYIIEGVKRYLEENTRNSLHGDYGYVYDILSSFYHNPTTDDKLYFSPVTVSTMPDHSDNHHPNFFESSSLLHKVKGIVRRTKLVNLMIRLVREVESKSKSYRGNTDDLLKKLLKYDVVSFDIFDTLVKRMCSQPADVFEALEEQCGLYDFKNTRIIAENEANTLHPELNEEASIYEIYEVLRHYYGDEAKRCSINQEIEQELAVCVPNPHIVEVFNELILRNKKVVITSDMYLTKQYLERILSKCGIFGYDQIFVSCEYHHSKRKGELFDDVKKTYGDKLKYIHIGDNHRSDYVMAKKNGWDAILIESK